MKKRIKKEGSKLAESDHFTPLSCKVLQGTGKDQSSSALRGVAAEGIVSKTRKSYFHTGFPHNIFYRCEDFAAEVPARTGKEKDAYDIVLCLSVTKWVHMHSGDDGLKRMFCRIYDCLKPGGVLMLEPQSVRSYKKARQKKMDGLQKNFSNDLKLKPGMFKEYLLKELGFDRFEMLRDVRESGQSFNRPVMAFFKAAEKQEDARKTAKAHSASKGSGVTNDSMSIVGQIVEDAIECVTGGRPSVAAEEVAQIIEHVFKQATSVAIVATTPADQMQRNSTGCDLKKKRQPPIKPEADDVKSPIKRMRKEVKPQMFIIDLEEAIDVDALADDGMNTVTQTAAL